MTVDLNTPRVRQRITEVLHQNLRGTTDEAISYALGKLFVLLDHESARPHIDDFTATPEPESTVNTPSEPGLIARYQVPDSLADVLAVLVRRTDAAEQRVTVLDSLLDAARRSGDQRVADLQREYAQHDRAQKARYDRQTGRLDAVGNAGRDLLRALDQPGAHPDSTAVVDARADLRRAMLAAGADL